MSTNDSSTAHFALDQIGATFNVSGAVDEDHRQLSLLEDETSQTIVMIDRLLSEVSDDVQRQTAYVANERGNLTVLASAIKNGELYGGTPGITAAAAIGGVQLASRRHAAGGDPLRSSQCGLSADPLCRAEPGAAGAAQCRFQVVAVSPTRGNAASVQIAQTTAAPSCPGSDAFHDRYGRARHRAWMWPRPPIRARPPAKCASSFASF